MYLLWSIKFFFIIIIYGIGHLSMSLRKVHIEYGFGNATWRRHYKVKSPWYPLMHADIGQTSLLAVWRGKILNTKIKSLETLFKKYTILRVLPWPSKLILCFHIDFPAWKHDRRVTNELHELEDWHRTPRWDATGNLDMPQVWHLALPLWGHLQVQRKINIVLYNKVFFILCRYLQHELPNFLQNIFNVKLSQMHI